MYSLTFLTHPHVKNGVAAFQAQEVLSQVASLTAEFLWESLQYALFAERFNRYDLLTRKHQAILADDSAMIYSMARHASTMIEIENGIEFEVRFKTPIPLTKGFHCHVCFRVDFNEFGIPWRLVVAAKDKTEVYHEIF
jgi:hypothetical protein